MAKWKKEHGLKDDEINSMDPELNMNQLVISGPALQKWIKEHNFTSADPVRKVVVKPPAETRADMTQVESWKKLHNVTTKIIQCE